jgi:hypothetical protein
MDARAYLMHVLNDLRETPDKKRRPRLQTLTKPVLIQVAEILLRKLEREQTRYQVEIEKRDFHIERLEAMLQPREDLVEEPPEPIPIESAAASSKRKRRASG